MNVRRSRGFALGASLFTIGALALPGAALAQRADDNAVTEAEDAFGVNVGAESIGLYNDGEVRGFNPSDAGNFRLEGLYLSIEGKPNSSLQLGNAIHVGIAALGHPFPAPTGIVDYEMNVPSGATSLSTIARVGGYGSSGLDIQGEIPIAGDSLAISAAASFRDNAPRPRRHRPTYNFAVIPMWRPSEDVEVIPFYSWSRDRDDSPEVIFVGGNYFPPIVSKPSFLQDWTYNRLDQEVFGTIARVRLSSDWQLLTGVFHSSWVKFRSVNEFFTNTTEDGLANHNVVAAPEQRRVGWSGETRLTRTWRGENFVHRVHAMVRGRRQNNQYGGSVSLFLPGDPELDGRVRLGDIDPVPEPDFGFGAQNHNRVTQYSGGLGYEGRWTRHGEINLGLQRAHYERVLLDGPNAGQTTANTSWLYNGLLAVRLFSGMAAYASYTKGIEDNGIAPNASTNRGEPMPAVITSQREIGLRYALTPKVTFIAGGFDLRKPYYNLNDASLFTELGELRTRGVELSLAGEAFTGLRFVAGAALMSPEVITDNPNVGKFAVDRTRNLIKATLDYRPPAFDAVSVDVGVEYKNGIAVSGHPFEETGEQLFVPAQTSVNVGARYRFSIQGANSVLRLLVTNVTDEQGWDPTSSGGVRRLDPRTFDLSLTTDF